MKFNKSTIVLLLHNPEIKLVALATGDALSLKNDFISQGLTSINSSLNSSNTLFHKELPSFLELQLCI